MQESSHRIPIDPDRCKQKQALYRCLRGAESKDRSGYQDLETSNLLDRKRHVATLGMHELWPVYPGQTRPCTRENAVYPVHQQGIHIAKGNEEGRISLGGKKTHYTGRLCMQPCKCTIQLPKTKKGGRGTGKTRARARARKREKGPSWRVYM